MLETTSYLDPDVLPEDVRNRWVFLETGSASAILSVACKEEWHDIIDVLSNFSLDPSSWLKSGGNRGEVAKTIDRMFHDRGWLETRLDLVTYALLRNKKNKLLRRLPRVVQEGYLVDNVKGRVALDVEWNAKDGNLDRDFGAYRAWHAAGALTAAVLITQDRLSLKSLATELWDQYNNSLPEEQRVHDLPIDLDTSTTTNLDKAKLRIRRGAAGSCPVLVIAACRNTWNGQPYSPLLDTIAT